MPSRRSPSRARSKKAKSLDGGVSRARGALLTFWIATLLLLVGCPSGGGGRPTTSADRAVSGIPDPERAFVVDPLLDYPLVVAQETERALREAYSLLALTGDTETVARRARELLATDPGLHPAQVLIGQTELLARRPQAAVDRLRRVTSEISGYTAAQLLLGRTAERAGDLPLAYRSYRSAAERSSVAAERAEVLRPRAVEILANRLEDTLRRGRLDRASDLLEQLRSWAPESDETLEAAFALASARGDRKAELEALEPLTARYPDRTELEVRQAELELAVGDATVGLRTLRDLAARHPDDREIEEALERAKFRWRLTLLPREVQELARRPELTRAELAVLVHWLVPQVRSTRRSTGRIAADILEHAFRDEIARVVNLGLMEVDSTLHTFSPDRPVGRADVLEALLRAVETFGAEAACLEGSPLGRRPTEETVCTAAARCRILPERADCLPGATLSGGEALDLIRRAVELLSPKRADTP